MDSPRRLNATTRCHSVFDCHSSFESFHDCCVATDSTVKFAPLPRTPLLRVLAEEADELNVIEIHRLFSPFSCPIFLGPLKSEWLLLPKRAAALWEGTQRGKGRNRESRSREAAGRSGPRKGAAEKGWPTEL